MQQGRESQTAVMVCQARAAAHGHSEVARYSDPTALALLPEEARRAVERFHASAAPANVRERVGRAIFVRRANMMVTRTVAIDDALRAAKSQQVVILGAGLDGRAWRMPELRDVTVFEVDHPDSQRMKRERAAALTPTAKDIRFVAVDFERDSLDAALAAAGHDSAKTTTWIWEGVVMYLERPAIESTLAVIQRRSASASRLIIAYHRTVFRLRLISLVLRRIGEPLRSSFTPAEMRELLAKYGYRVVSDGDLPTLAAAIHPHLVRDAKQLSHLHVVIADAA
jgi:methyltransferase (TIGR00027 family)